MSSSYTLEELHAIEKENKKREKEEEKALKRAEKERNKAEKKAEKEREKEAEKARKKEEKERKRPDKNPFDGLTPGTGMSGAKLLAYEKDQRREEEEALSRAIFDPLAQEHAQDQREYDSGVEDEEDAEDAEPMIPVERPTKEKATKEKATKEKSTKEKAPRAKTPKAHKYTIRVPSSVVAGQIILYIMTHKPVEQPRIMNAMQVKPISKEKSSARNMTFMSTLTAEEFIQIVHESADPILISAFQPGMLTEVLPKGRAVL